MTLPVALSSTDSPQAMPLLPLLGDSLARWQLHRCQITDALITKQAPMKMLYHYEHLAEDIKTAHPLQGKLLLDFDTPMTAERFATVLGIKPNDVSTPWQLKFNGKLVIFFEALEIALRLHWTNTLKPFEPVYQADLATAVMASFAHWQFVGAVEIISKNSQVLLTASHPDLAQEWQLAHAQAFSDMPAVLALDIQQYLHSAPNVSEIWLPEMQAAARDFALEQQDSQRLI